MEESTFLSAPNILVTSTRIDLNGQTFAVRNVGSVRVDRTPASVLYVLFGVLFGFAALVSALSAQFVNASVMAVLAVGLIAIYQQRRAQRKLILVTGGGVVTALESRDAAAVERLREAIAQAISVR